MEIENHSATSPAPANTDQAGSTPTLKPEVLERHRQLANGSIGTGKRGRGRPKGSTSKKPAQVISDGAADSTAVDTSPDEILDPIAVKEGCKGVWSVVDEFSRQSFRTMALSASADENFAHKCEQEVGMSEGKLNLLSSSSAQVLMKYPFLARYMTEGLLLTAILQQCFTMKIVASKIEAVAKERALKNAGPAVRPQADQNPNNG